MRLRPDRAREALSRSGAQLRVVLHNGGCIHGEVCRAVDGEGAFDLLPWGTSRPIAMRIADVVSACAAEASSAEYFRIAETQRAALAGDTEGADA